MMVDTPLASTFAMNTALEDFFNFEMLSGSSGGPSSSSSRSSSNSPSQSFAALPPTPPNAFDPMLDSTSSMFNFYLDEDYTKVDPHALPPTTGAPYDFLGTLSPAALSSPEESFGTSSASPASNDSPVTIDPQLVDSPASSTKPQSEFGEDDDRFDDEDDFDDLDDVSITPVKVGGKGKDRKGTVQSGGVVKKSGGGHKQELKPAGMLSTTSTDPDDWRPTPEEYKKMTSKEKRQLRNKISARNFRVRRKEYITTLEGDIAERDRLIDAIRSELGSTKSENVALRSEISALKKLLLEGRGTMDTPVLPPPAPLPAVSAAVLASDALKSPRPAPKSPLLTPNLHKDLPTSPRLAGRNFWGGSLGGFGGITPVHTTLVPDLSSVLSGKPAGRKTPALQENINPMLNSQPQNEKTMELSLPVSAFDSFTDMNPFTMKTIDAYRMQLWSRMAQHHQAQAGHGQQQQQPHQQQMLPPPTSQTPPQHFNGLAGGLRPHFFAKNATLPAILAGKPASSSYGAPPILHTSGAHNLPHGHPTAQQAMLASMASQTLLGKLGSAFWDAFSGSSRQQWDADKVRKVLEGKAVVRIVDVEPSVASVPPPGLTMRPTTPVAPVEKIAGPSRSPKVPSSPPAMAKDPNCNPSACLEKMFGSLRI